MPTPTVDPVTAFMTLFRAELLTLTAVTDCIGEHLFNSVAASEARPTYGIFQVAPLADITGQARTSIQTRLLCDLKFISRLPMDQNVPAAIAAAKDHFRSSSTFDQDGYRISIRHDRPIEFTERGSNPDDVLLHRGGTFAVWITATSD